ncbi:MAG: hypothetical protein A2W00_01930 [Candidatus Eisenbacteria bacterium RBG_16_71_46]|nr:MAG: hypothetical protein A2W00_01930 [Candidatus Eisenbacteria bacterium RBG_16_71_46]OGF22183.1 MAG: hypothetical protein A2V63_02495 [Candidatus Eisenbacteria bacterium RBG_19FT_COMBO_70_11]
MNLDRRAIVAIALCVLFLLLYQPLLRWMGLGKYLDAPRRQATEEVVPGAVDTVPERAQRDLTSTRGEPGTEARGSAKPSEITAPPIVAARAELEHSLFIDTPLYRAAFSNRGARLVSVELKRYASGFAGATHVHHGELVPAEDRVVLAGGPSLGLDLGSGASLLPLADLVYASKESLDAAGSVRAITFSGTTREGLRLRQTYRVRPDSYALDLEVEFVELPAGLRVPDYSITTRSWPLFTEADYKGDERQLRSSSLVGTNIHREHVGGLVKGARSFEGNVAWAGVQSRYFLGAVAITEAVGRSVISQAQRLPLTERERQELAPNPPADRLVAVTSLVASLPTSHQPVNRFLVYFGPAEYSRLDALGQGLDRAVDLGWIWLQWFSQWLLRLMNWIDAVVQNYGVAIIVLATLVRVLLHPLNMTSMRSMRAMQKLQPEIERLKAKYKNDAQAMNTGMMALYKENKVNPAGGCLPMLMQMPLFIALYQVLFNAIELRQAPFLLWMNDLSAPDQLFMVAGFPIRVLPILMAGSGFIQQWMTPTDPRQAPTMYMMNLFMLVFFYNLPSGLVLYWTVMNVLTALQQLMVLRQDGQVALPVAAPEEGGGKPGKRSGRQAVAKRATEK